MTHPTGTEILLTSEDVRCWQDELHRLEQIAKETAIRIAELRRKLDAVALITGNLTATQANQTLAALAVAGGTQPVLLMARESADDHDKDETLGEAAKRLLGTFGRPVFHYELQTELRKIPRFQEMLSRNNGAYYYTMIMRLAEARAIEKVGKKVRIVHKDETLSEETTESAPKVTAGSSHPQHAMPSLASPVNP